MAAIGLLLAWSGFMSGHAFAGPHDMPGAPAHIRSDDADAARLRQLEPVVRLAPHGTVQAVVILLSDRQGWTAAMQRDAVLLGKAGIAVAGLSTPHLLHALAAAHDACTSPNLSLSLLAKDFEHRLGLARYMRPIIAGRGLGGSIAFAGLEQGPALYSGGVSLGFDGRLPATRAWCATRHPIAQRLPGPQAGWRLRPGQSFAAPWIAVPADADEQKIAQSFVGALPEGSLHRADGASILDVLHPLVGQRAPVSTAAGTAAIAALPLATVIDAAAPRGRYMAVFYSGDGGWASFDRNTASALAARGVPVVGVDSLSYFWGARRPVEAAADLARVIDHYQHSWGKRRVILVGFSFGADNLPFIVNALPQRLRPLIARISLLGLSDRTDFQFHLESWLDMTHADAMQTIPAITSIRSMPVQCIRGADELDSACIAIPQGHVLHAVVPGGHHFQRDFPRIAQTILRGLGT